MSIKQFLLTLAASLAVAAISGAVSADQVSEFRAGTNEAEHRAIKEDLVELKADMKAVKDTVIDIRIKLAEMKGR